MERWGPGLHPSLCSRDMGLALPAVPLEWAGQCLGGSYSGWGGEGKAQLTSWEISKCFLAKVRACAGLPMDT